MSKQREEPIGYFLQDMEYHGKSERTIDAYERVLRRFERFLQDPERHPGESPLTPGEAGQRECMAWVHDLRDDVAPSTVATYASYLHRFYAYMVQIGTFEANPMGLVREEMDESIDTDPTRREVSLPAMRAFVAETTHPLDRAIVCTFLKTGVRVGELVNLDLRDLSLSEGPRKRPPRPELDGRTDWLFVDADVSRGTVHNGEQREASNKRERSTVVPIDDELGSVLVRWLAIRPDARSTAEPLFVSTGDEWGRRLTPAMVRQRLKKHATAAGWYRKGGDADENVTPHYFRHFFTTHLRDRTGDRGVVKYLRGDVAEDIIDTYTHNWGNRVRETYESNIYSIFG